MDARGGSRPDKELCEGSLERGESQQQKPDGDEILCGHRVPQESALVLVLRVRVEAGREQNLCHLVGRVRACRGRQGKRKDMPRVRSLRIKFCPCGVTREM